MTELELYNRARSGPWTTSGRNVQWRLEVIEDAVYLFFQYTAGIWPKSSDWWYNLRFWPRRVEGGLAHAGFSLLWESAKDAIEAALLEYSRAHDKIVVVGISQGAALATAAHWYLARHRVERVTTYAFAAPCYWHRVGLGMGVRVCSQPPGDTVHTIYVRGDVVALILYVFGYLHVGRIHRRGSPHFPHWRRHTFAAYEGALENIEL